MINIDRLRGALGVSAGEVGWGAVYNISQRQDTCVYYWGSFCCDFVRVCRHSIPLPFPVWRTRTSPLVHTLLYLSLWHVWAINYDSCYIVLLYLVMFIVWVSRRRGIRLFVFVEVYRTGVPSPNSIGSLVQSGQIIFASGVLLANRLVCVLMVR